MKQIVALTGPILLITLIGVLSGCLVTGIKTTEAPCERALEAGSPNNDQELATLLVTLELRTRAVIAGHYVGADETHRCWLSETVLLPAAVADQVFHEVVPKTTGGRAWVRMVVDEPRNEHNRGDEIAISLYHQIKDGKPSAAHRTQEAYYYAEPIKTGKACLACHGDPRGEPDPFFPQYKKNGWKEGEIIGAVVARVAQAQ